MNNDVYNNKGTSSLDEAYARLNEAIKKRNASSTNQQYDNTNGVALNTTPLAVNEEQSEEADWFTRTYATGLQAYQNLQRGVTKTFEGVIDFALQLVGVFDADLAEKMISYDITETLLKTFDADSRIYRAITGKELQDQSWLYEADEKIQDTIISVEQGVGNAIGMMGIGALTGGGGAAFGLMAAGAGGQTVEGVFADPNYSGNFAGAVGYGITSGLAEGAIEYASMGIGNALNGIASKTGIKALENTAGVFTGNYAGKNLGGKVVSYLVSAVSEGGEEVLSEVADPFIKTIYTKDSVGESWQNNFSKEQLDNAFLVGTLSSMLVNGGAVIETTREATKYGVDRYGNINRETIEEAAQIKEEMEYMSRNQGQYSQNQYNEMMTQYTKRLDELYRDIESTANSKALGRAEQFMQDAQIDRGTLQGEEFSKKVAFNTNTQKRIEQFEELIKRNNDRVGVQEAFNVELEASEKPLTDKEGKKVDAYYDSTNKKIVFSKTISPTKAFNFLASHELKHHLDTRADLKDINNHILEFLKSTNEYAKRKENLKKLGYKDKEIDEEMVADYIGELFKANRSFEQMFTTKEKAEKIASLLSLMRKETSDEYIRARYAEAIAKLRNAETYREPTKAVAYNKAETKYSRATPEDTGTSIAQTSKLIEKEIEKARDFVKEIKNYPDSDIRNITNALSQEIKDINHTTASTLAKDARTVLSSFDGDKFLTNEKLKDAITPEQQLYLKEAFAYLKSRISLKKNGKPAKLSYTTKINDSNYSLLEGKTEGQVVLDTLRIIKKVLKTSSSNIVKINNKEVDRKVITKEEIERQKAFGRDEQKAKKGLLKTIKQIATSIFDGVSYFDVLGHTDSNSIFKDFYEELYTGEIEHLRVKQDFQSDVDKFVKKHKSLVKKFKNKKNKVTIAGKQVYFGEALGFYMALEAENTPSHIFAAERSGMYFTGELGRDVTITQQEFISVLSEDLQTKLKDKDKLKPEEKKELYRKCAEELRTKIKEELGKDVDEFVTLLKSKYKKSGKVYQDVSMESVGFSYPIQDNYYPIKSDIRAFAKQSGTIDTTANYMNNVMSPSFTNKLSTNASNMLRADDVLDTFYHFTNQLAVWSQISTRIKNLDRLLNTTINIQGQKFRDYINDYIDPDFTKRYESLVLSTQGINKNPKTAVDKILNKTRGINATVALSLNAKTVAIQPTAYTKYWLYVSPKNWLKAFATNKGLMDFKELIELSPLVYDRYFGNQGRNIAEAQTVGASQHIGKLGELGMKLISKSDEIPLKLGWKAVQLEAMDKGITDKAEIVKMFEKATYETQATYDALSNGSAVRVDNEIAKSFFMFSSENRKTLSRFFHSLYAIGVDKTNKAAWRELAGSTTSMLTSAAMIALISSLLKRLKDDEEEEEFLNMYLKEFSSNMVGVFPIVSNIYNKIVLGYDIQLTGFSQITDLFDIPKYCEQLMETGATEAQKTSAVMQISQRLAHLLGIPFRNIYNDILYLAGLGDLAFDSNMVMKLRNFYYNTDSKTTSTLIKTYSKRNDMEKLSAMIQVRNEKFGAGKINEKVSNEMARLYNKGVLETFPSQLQSEYTVDGVIHKLSKTQYKQAQDIYSLANEAMELMVVSSQYSGLSDEEKAQAIKKLYGAYYEASKTSVINASEGTKLSKVVKYIDSGKFASYLAKIDGLKASTPINKKSVVQSYINRLGISKNEKYLLAHLAGYSISDEAKKAVSTYLRSKGMAYKDSNEYFK